MIKLLVSAVCVCGVWYYLALNNGGYWGLPLVGAVVCSFLCGKYVCGK